MKLLFSLLLICSLGTAYGQQGGTQSTEQFFGQCLFNITNQAEMDALQAEMAQNPNIDMVRLDMNTQRALVITSWLTDLTEQEFVSWFGSYGSSVTCVQVGVYGVDAMNPYPFTNCQN